MQNYYLYLVLIANIFTEEVTIKDTYYPVSPANYEDDDYREIVKT